MENKTIDLVLSKPIKRWEYVFGKQLQHIITIIAVILSSVLCLLAAIAINPKIIAAEVDIAGFIIGFLWLSILLIAIESTVLLISTIFDSKKATMLGFAIVMGLWFISAYGANLPIDNIEYISIFTYFNPRAILIDGVLTDVLPNILILLVYGLVLSIFAMVYYTKRDIPV